MGTSSPKQRPLSPHLQIYKLPFTALTSIAHRLTGIALAFAAVVYSYFLMLLAGTEEDYDILLSYLDMGCVQALSIVASFVFVYHMLNGIRHLFWELGFGFELKDAKRSGVAVILGTIIITVLFWSCIWAQTAGGAQ